MTRVRHLIWITALLLLVIPQASFGQAPVTDDAFVSSATPTSNNGTSPSLVVQAPGGKTLIKFDLSRIPTGAVTAPVTSSMVAKATMKLYVTAVTAQGTFDVYRVAGTWAEKTVTYNTAPVLGPQLATGIAVSTTSKYVIVDVTQVVKDWLDCLNSSCSIGQANNGIILQPSTGSSISVTFESKESTTTSHDPELNVVLTGPVGPQGPQGIQGVVGPQGPVGPAPVAGTGITVTPGQNNTSTVALDQTYANGIYAQKSGNNTFSGINTFTGKTDLSSASATLPVRTITGAPPTGASICAAGQMILQKDAPTGQQLFICNSSLNGWVLVNDDSTLATSVTAETTRATTAETGLQNNINAEAATRAAADTTLQNNINSEASSRAAADATLTTNLNNEISNRAAAVTAEATARAAADTAETNRAQGAEGSRDRRLGTEASTRAAHDGKL